MKVLIVEDEVMARKALARTLESRYPQMRVVGCTGSVAETVQWLNEHSANGAGMHGGWMPDNGADVIFMDVELSDGNCFEIFRQVQITAKVIMTTAYDSYAIKAFEAGSLDYLLKPVSPADLDRAVSRVLRSGGVPADFGSVLRAVDEGRHRERFIVRLNDRIVPVKVEDIAYFCSEEKSNFLCTFTGRKYIVDSSLDIIADELPEKTFFRISRSCIISVKAIQSIVKQASGRLLIISEPPAGFEMTVSRARVDDFMSWLSA
mgnify:FL=1